MMDVSLLFSLQLGLVYIAKRLGELSFILLNWVLIGVL